ncbi:MULTISPECIES: phage tail protein [Pantoea]|uniref:phage tail-collar fiber domain-containing protein n=1 Tax=Pantoea TaxID=53335 RepID=UPI0009DF4B6C|nr:MULTISPECIES: phage tail protein [Pantoea]
MTTKYYALLTNLGASKLANAAALGTKLQITQMAVGDGGGTLPTPNATQTKLVGEKRRAALNSLSIDAANSSQIIAEQVIPETEGGFWIREIGLFDADGVLIAVANCAETYKPQLQEGSGRTQTVRMILIVSSTDAVTLKIDPSIVLATRQYVDNAVIEVKAYADDLMAKHVAAADPHTQYAPKASPTLTGTPKAPTPAVTKNDTQIATTAFGQALMKAHNDAADPHGQYLLESQLSSDINSTSETQAATPKAVKAVNDSAFKVMGSIASGIDTNSLGPLSMGSWSIGSSTTQTNPNLPEATQGVLNIFPAGLYGCTQEYITRYGTIYIRTLGAAWDASKPVWLEWQMVGYQTQSGYFSGDLNTLVAPGRYSVTTSATNMPAALVGTVDVMKRSSGEILQTFRSVSVTSGNSDREWKRTGNGTATVWTAWTETATVELVKGWGLGVNSTTAPNYIFNPGQSGNTTSTQFVNAKASDDQATAHNPVSGEDFAGLNIQRELRPIQIGVSGRGAAASLWFRGYSAAGSLLADWKQVTTTINAVPIGVPLPWPAETAPAGWLKCNGASFSATTYPELAKAYPSLKLPDLRGEFIRGWDDGRGVDSSRELLSAQGHALQQHTHTVAVPLRTTDSDRGSLDSTYSVDNTQTVTTSGASGNTATETRPRNIAFNYIVRAA